MGRPVARRPGTEAAGLPAWISPQLTELVKEPPDGPDWLHEIKYDVVVEWTGQRRLSRLRLGYTIEPQCSRRLQACPQYVS
jgi:hypothetical protein